MILRTIISDELAHFSYLLGDEESGECIVIDPRRDHEAYLAISLEENLRITGVVDTHIQADYASGAVNLAREAGAALYMGHRAAASFPFTPLREGDQLAVGQYRLLVLETPGHTPEHLSLVVSGGDASGAPWGVFTGDTLFSGEVGRPDLLGDGSEGILVRQLYHSLFQKLLPLGDGVIVFPGHGKGSPCGAQIGDRPFTTIGYERQHNPALKVASQEAFATQVLGALSAPPAYYRRLKHLNGNDPLSFSGIPSLTPLSPAEVQRMVADRDALLLDTRPLLDFAGAHIPGAIHIALGKPFPIWVGWLLDPGQKIILVVEDASAADRVVRNLLRIGHDSIAGFLKGGMADWLESGRPFSRIPQVSVHDLHEEIAGKTAIQLIDLRGKKQHGEGHIPGAIPAELPTLLADIAGLDPTRPVYIACVSGYRSSIGASLLRRAGFSDVAVVAGSLKAWLAAGYPLE